MNGRFCRAFYLINIAVLTLGVCLSDLALAQSTASLFGLRFTSDCFPTENNPCTTELVPIDPQTGLQAPLSGVTVNNTPLLYPLHPNFAGWIFQSKSLG